MILGKRTVGALVATAVLVGGATPVGRATVATGAEAEARLDAAAMKVVGDCKGGTGKIALTVLPTAENIYQVTVKARRVLDHSRWRAELFASGGEGSEGVIQDDQTFRPRAVDGSWSVTTEVDLSGGGQLAVFDMRARTSNDKGGNINCVAGSSPARPVEGYSLCARSFHVLDRRQREDGTLLVRHTINDSPAGTRWRLLLKVANAAESQSVVFHNVSGKYGVMQSRVELSAVPEDSRFTVRANSERGGHCYLRVNPGPLTAATTSGAMSPRVLNR